MRSTRRSRPSAARRSTTSIARTSAQKRRTPAEAAAMTPAMMVGAALFFAGVLTILVLFALERSLAKSQQLGAIGRLASGKAGGGRRVAFFLALGCLFF